jgi:hypothetical protein
MSGGRPSAPAEGDTITRSRRFRTKPTYVHLRLSQMHIFAIKGEILLCMKGGGQGEHFAVPASIHN